MLPNAEQARIDLRKLTGYCLSATHREGRHKAELFRAALGMTAANALLRDWLLEAARTIEAIPQEVDEHGARFRIDFVAATGHGSAVIRSA